MSLGTRLENPTSLVHFLCCIVKVLHTVVCSVVLYFRQEHSHNRAEDTQVVLNERHRAASIIHYAVNILSSRSTRSFMGISNHTSKYGTSYNKQTQSTQSQTDEMFNELKRVLTERCHSPLVMEKEFVASSEGHFSTFEDYDIRMVQVVTRHGERAPMFATALIGMKIFYCPDGSRQLFSASDLSHTVCYKAQMTWTGCRQLQLIGRHFRKAYSFNLTVGQLENRIRLLSTGRQRTDWSARCLVAGLLGHTNYNKLVRVNLAMVPYALHTKYVKSCPYREKLLNQIRKNLKYQQSASYWTSAVNRGNSFITATGYNGRNLTYIHQFNEALVSHFCNLYHKGISASITPCVKKHCMPPSLSLEILKAADVHVKSQNDQKVRRICSQELQSNSIANCITYN